jgi:hypothetical protein
MTITIDASVYVAAALPGDTHFETSRAFLRSVRAP